MDQSELLSMSDEDFLKLNSAPEVLPADQQVATPPAVETPSEPASQSQQPAATPEVAAAVEEQNPLVPEQQPPANQETQPTAEELAAQQTAAAVKPEGEVTTPPATPAEPVVEEVDYKAAYERLMKPIKANGKEIQLKSVDELVQLAQQGANYTRKMQELAPHRKTLMMLENNGIDQEKLSFLLDLQRKDPAAIQKFLRESGVNPLDIDTEAEPTYKGGNHTVTDEEANFREALDTAKGSEHGQYVLQSINSSWDQASKELLLTQPSIIETLVHQREDGFYDRIVGEMDRQRILGQLPVGQTWLQSYKTVGEQMVSSGAFADLVAKEQQQQQTPPQQVVTPVATRVLTPTPQVTANAKAAAAAPSRAAPAAAKTLINPLQMSDDEFLKQFANRL